MRKSLIRSCLSKIPVLRGRSHTCWLTLLPTQLRTELLLTIGAQTKAMDSVMTLAREFPEFGQLVLVLHWTRGSLLDVAGTKIKVVSLKSYASLPKKLYDDRPVKLMIKDFTDPHLQQFPSHQMDGSLTCLLSRFIDSHTMVWVDMISKSASCALLDRCPPSVIHKQITKAGIHSIPLSTLVLDYNIPPRRPGSHCSSPLRYQSKIKGRPSHTLLPGSGDGRDSKSWEYRGPTRPKLAVLFFLNFAHYNISGRQYRVEYLEIRLRAEKLDSVTPQRVILPQFASRLLHITFESYRLPIIQPTSYLASCMKHFPSLCTDVDYFVLQNANWSPKNPYGSTMNFPLQEGNHVAMDQATYHRATRWQRAGERQSPFKLPLGTSKTVKLYGVPDLTLLCSPFDSVTCLYWWRLTPRVDDVEDDGPPAIIQCPSLKELHIISVIKGDEYRPLFQAPQLTKLVLISLHDSDVPWSIKDTLFGQAPNLADVYIERRTDPSRDMALPMAIGSEELRKIAPTVRTLHVRGYIPDVFIIGHSQAPNIFQQLQTLILDVSELSRLSGTSLCTEKGSADVTLDFEHPGFPVLRTLSLMCTEEANLSGELSNTTLQVLVGPSCTRVHISDTVEPLSITLNGQQLETDRSRGPCMVHSRGCETWTSEAGAGPFHDAGFMVFCDWVVDKGEY